MTFLNSLDQTYNENLISDYLAWLLHPERNGIGWAPLKNVFQAITGEEMPVTHQVTIFREYILREDRRLDILIQMDDCILAIENKIKADESPGQTVRYCQDLHHEFRYGQIAHYYAFLTRSGDKAECKAFQALSYRKLIDVLKRVDLTTTDEKYRMLYNDFIRHVEGYIVVNTKRQKKMSNLYLQNYEMVDELKDQHKKHLKDILNKLKDYLQEYWSYDEWQYDFTENRNYQQIRYRRWQGPPDIHIEFHMQSQRLRDNNIMAVIDIEGSGADEMFSKCREMLSKNEDKLAKEVKWRPGRIKRNFSLIEREYSELSHIIEANDEDEENEAIKELADKVWMEFSCIVSKVFETAMNES